MVHSTISILFSRFIIISPASHIRCQYASLVRLICLILSSISDYFLNNIPQTYKF
uniref:Uncharacterized protein n=1 Tax=Arundo donax TaxID=35708 RepID=A0A0A9AY39_ARUDO